MRDHKTDTTKIVYNNCYGGFSLSDEGIALYKTIKGSVPNNFYDRDIDRADPALVEVVETLGEKADGGFASLKIREIPKGTKYRIDEYDGSESVMTIEDYDWETA